MKNKTELYSFDIFDTIVTRKVATPKGIFAIMQEILKKNKDFSQGFKDSFYKVRIESEELAVENYKTASGHPEISFEDIYKQMQNKYMLSYEQTEFLKNLEIKLESENLVGINKNIDKIKQLISCGKRVILISDMYYNVDTLRKFLTNIDEIFKDIKIYVSSECKVSKFNGSMYKYIRSIENIDYNNWEHSGDNELADIKQAKILKINTIKYDYPNLLPYEKELINTFPNNVNIQLMLGISKLLRLNEKEENPDKYDFGASFSGPVLYNYISEVLDTSVQKGFQTLYFVARDGCIPKLVADIIIKSKNLPVKTKYIYGSRLVWRIPNEENYESFIEMNFKEYQNKISLDFLSYRFGIPAEALNKYTPFIKNTKKILNEQQRVALKECFLNNKELRSFVLESYDERRNLLFEYLKQEIDFNEPDIVFVEVNGSGKTQILLTEYMNKIQQCKVHTFYLTVSPETADSNISRFVYCTRPKPYNTSLELICRTNYGQTIGYKKEASKIVPITENVNQSVILNWGYNEHLKGITDFANAASCYRRDLSDKELFYTYFDYITQRCDPKTAEILGDVPFLLVGNENNVKKAAPKLSILQILFCLISGKPIEEYSVFPYLSYVRGNIVVNFVRKLLDRMKFISNLLVELKLYMLIRKLKTSRIVFWGASIFLENFVKKWHIKYDNIVGIIDRNPKRWEQTIGKYKIFPPESISELDANFAIMTIKNRNKTIYKDVSEFFEKNYNNIKLLPNIFYK